MNRSKEEKISYTKINDIDRAVDLLINDLHLREDNPRLEDSDKQKKENKGKEDIAGASADNRNFLIVMLGGEAHGTLFDKGAMLSLIATRAAKRFRDRWEKARVTSLTEHHIDVQGAVPIKHRVRRMSSKMLEIATAEIDRIRKEGIIERSASDRSTAPVLVSKSNGEYRFCVDYRDVNRVTRKDAYPIPNMDSI